MFALNFDEPVLVVEPLPRIGIQIGDNLRWMDYVDFDGISDDLISYQLALNYPEVVGFAYTIQADDIDEDGVEFTDDFFRNHESIVNLAGLPMPRNFVDYWVDPLSLEDGLFSDTSVIRQPSTGPELRQISFKSKPPNSWGYEPGEFIHVEYEFNYIVNVTGDGEGPTIPLRVGDKTVTAKYNAELSEWRKLVFSYQVQPGDRGPVATLHHKRWLEGKDRVENLLGMEIAESTDLAPPPATQRASTFTPDPVMELIALRTGWRNVALVWDVPASDGNAPITSYEIAVNGATESSVEVTGRSTLSSTLTGASANGAVTHSYKVRAVNLFGPGPWSEPVPYPETRFPGHISDTNITGSDPLEPREDWYRTSGQWRLRGSGSSGVLANDKSQTATDVRAVIGTSTSNGDVILGWDGSFVYTPNPGYTGSDEFTYFLQSDPGGGVTSSAAVRAVINVDEADASKGLRSAPIPADTTAPTITGANITSRPLVGTTYQPGEAIELTLTTSEEVVVTAATKPHVFILFDLTNDRPYNRKLIFNSEKSSSNRLVLDYIVEDELDDSDGVEINGRLVYNVGHTVDLNNSTRVVDLAGNVLRSAFLMDRGPHPSHKVGDTGAPSVSSVEFLTVPQDRGQYLPGETIAFLHVYDEPVKANTTYPPEANLLFDSGNRIATYDAARTAEDGRKNVIAFSYVVQENDYARPDGNPGHTTSIVKIAIEPTSTYDTSSVTDYSVYAHDFSSLSFTEIGWSYAGYILPTAPRDFVASRDSLKAATLRWFYPVADGNRAIEGYEIQVKGPEDESFGASIQVDGRSTLAHTFATSTPPGTTFRIRASSKMGDDRWASEWSNEAVLGPNRFNLVPLKVTGVRATPTPSGTGMALSWSPPDDEDYGYGTVDEYVIERFQLDASGAVVSKQVMFLLGNSTTFTDTELAPDTTYSYRVSARYPFGDGSIWSAILTTGFQLRNDGNRVGWGEGLSGGRLDDVDLKYEGVTYKFDSIRLHTPYVIPYEGADRRRVNGFYELLVVTFPQEPPDFLDDYILLVDGREFPLKWARSNYIPNAYTWVTGSYPFDEMDWPTGTPVELAIRPAANVDHPTEPEGYSFPGAATSTTFALPGRVEHVRARPSVDGTQVTLSWHAPADDGGRPITGYTVWDAEDWTPGSVCTASYDCWSVAGETSLELNNLVRGSTYSYRVVASNSVGDGVPSKPVAVTAPTVPTEVASVGFTLSPRSDGQAITLTWQAPYDGGSPITGYVLTREGYEATLSDGLSESDPVTLRMTATPGQTTVSYTDTGVRPSSFYFYYVKVLNDVGTSRDVAGERVWTYGLPLPVQGLSATPGDTGGVIDLTWDSASLVDSSPLSFPVTEYERHRWNGATATGEPDHTTTFDVTTSVNDSGLMPGTAYTYRLRGLSSVGEGEWSDTVTATTLNPPGQVTDLTLTPVPMATSTPPGIDLSWEAPDDGSTPITSYLIRRSRPVATTTLYAAPESESVTDPSPTATTTVYYIATTTSFADLSLEGDRAYTYQVRAFNRAGFGEWSAAAKIQSPYTPPSFVHPIHGRLSGDGRESMLVWSAPYDGGKPIEEYEIERAEVSGPFGWLATIPETATSTVHSYTDTGLDPDVPHTYRVRAVNELGPGGWSHEFSLGELELTEATPTPPGSVIGLRAATSEDGTSITLTWDTPTTGGAVTQYEIQRDDDSGKFLVLATVPATATSTYSDLALTAGTTYTYQVRAHNSQGARGWSNLATATAPVSIVPIYTVPDRVTGLTATTTDDGTGIVVAWEIPPDRGSPITEYQVRRDDGDGTVVTVSTAAAIYTDRDVAKGVDYTFQVRAKNAAGPGLWSDPVIAQVPITWTDIITEPEQVTGVSATLTEEGTDVDLAWNAPNDGGSTILLYEIQRIFLGGPGTTHSDAGLTPGATYTYQVRARNVVGPGPWSNAVQVAVPLPEPDTPATPGQVTGLEATADRSGIALSWDIPDDGGSPITEYEIQRDYESEGFAFLATNVGEASTNYSDSGLVADATYTYQVRARNGAGYGPWSESASAEAPTSTTEDKTATSTPPATATSTPPSQVSGLSATVAEDGSSITLSWNIPDDGGSEILDYHVEGDAGLGTSVFAHLAELFGKSTTTWTDALVSPGNTYIYRVEAGNKLGYGPYSEVISVNVPPAQAATTTPPGIITEFSATSTSDGTGVVLSWEAPDDGGAAIDGYHIGGDGGSGTPGSIVLLEDGEAKSYTDSGLTPGTTYTYTIQARNRIGFGDWSQPISVTLRR